MSNQILHEVRSALASLNPAEVIQSADHPLRIGLVASCGEAFATMEDFLAPPGQSPGKRELSLRSVYRIGEGDTPDDLDFVLCEAGMPAGEDALIFDSRHPIRTVREAIDRFPSLSLPLARRFEPFRAEVCDDIVGSVARENALFSLATALPNIVPFSFSMPWTVGEFASDATVLTANQIRMAFLLAAASDRNPGYREQKSEIASMIAGGFGWRSVARVLAGRIPLGGGLIPKAAIAFAGTWVAGKSLEILYRLGYPLSRDERGDALTDAFERGKYIAAAMLDAWRGVAPARA